jgi:KDO2-lipid IV(A) lauroyltransferase
MSHDPRSARADFLAYLAVRLAVCILQALPFSLVCRLAEFFAWVAYYVDGRHRQIALENLRYAFPGKYTEAELDLLVRKVFRHFCLMLMEILFLPRLVHNGNWRRCLRYRSDAEAARMVELWITGRPVLMASAHFGNWEVSSYVLGLLGIEFCGIARPLDNPFLDAWLRRFREAHGQKIIAKKGEFDEIQGVLARGGVLGTLADQDAGQRGLYVNFFHRPASTHKAVALLSLGHNVPIAVIAAARLDRPLQYLAMVEDVIYPEEYDGRPDAVKAITQRFTTALENIVRCFPEQYFWLHRRWKHQPAKANKEATAARSQANVKPVKFAKPQAAVEV